VTPRALNNWKRKPPKKCGRPRYTNTQRKAALFAVGRALRRLGYPGEKAIELELPNFPLRLIREYVRLLKARRNAYLTRKRREHRVSVKVTAKNVILSQDGARIGRSMESPVDALVAKDRGSQQIMSSLGPLTEEHTIETLESVRQERGLPLVYGTDNGPNFTSEGVERYLERNEGIHIRNLPRTPQHNAAVERAVRELKNAAALGKWARVDEKEAAARLALATKRLNANRYRESYGASADVLDATMPAAYNLVNRSEFFAECRAAMWNAANAQVNARKRRMAERNAIYETLAKYGLVEMTIGGKQTKMLNAKSEMFL